MSSRYPQLLEQLRSRPSCWLVTGGAGFIGSHLVERLLGLGQRVRVLDDFSTGRERNLELVRQAVGEEASARLEVLRGDIRDPRACDAAAEGAQVVLHQAALGSVPRSIAHPEATHEVNVSGFVQVLQAARRAGIRRLVYASSSSVYGDSPALPKVEEAVGRPLSPYAASKACDELYAAAFARCYGLELVGLRYFNVFGPRQDPAGPYAAVIPRWFEALLSGRAVEVFGDGETSRDFCYVQNVVQANLLAACVEAPESLGRAYNVAVGRRTTLNELFVAIRDHVARLRPELAAVQPVHREFRPGDVRHSLADVGAARALLGYEPTHDVAQGLREAADWYLSPEGHAAPAAPGAAREGAA
ncbi:SDR family oxidoreductase [Anaeromyxobacter paludicola]|uniref:NAD-dependent epimerase n=1 Tax=Anaeromyxobacter paludicola TaxID=2918171 RepID=A0ABM7X9J4_9BACT|nr:SDR family oxidoreductase [Anaeromyxobacter paludicola]BDG08521.1 NAD-dependent epimerase [Anaeromyxobacter paludicola]